MSNLLRKRLACRICTQRKVKCDKKVPCVNCVRRGTIAECERPETDELNSQSNILVPGRPDDDAVFSALGRRVAELEATLQQKNAESSSPVRSPTLTTEQDVSRAVPPVGSSSPSQDSDIEDAV